MERKNPERRNTNRKGRKRERGVFDSTYLGEKGNKAQNKTALQRGCLVLRNRGSLWGENLTLGL